MKNIFYGCGGRYVYFAEKLIEQNIYPDCFVDENPGKQGWSDKFNVPIYSLAKAMEIYGDEAAIYLTASRTAQILEYLLANGVDMEKIKNINSKKRKTCCFIENALTILSNGLGFCCVARGDIPVLKYELIENNEYAAGMKKYYDEVIEKLGDENGCDICNNCQFIQEYSNFGTEHTIREVHIVFSGICNFDCIYCIAPGRGGHLAKNIPDVIKILSDFDLSECEYINVSCEEITALPGGNDMLKQLASMNIPLYIYSNCAIYSEEITSALKINSESKVVVSMDAGNKTTFAEVKQNDVYERVLDNVRKYAAAGNVGLKYILLPGINDDDDNIDGFADFCIEINPFEVLISRDSRGYRTGEMMPEKTIAAGRKLYNKLYKNGIIAKDFMEFVPGEFEQIFKITP
jgi:pyruvate-formate lyase-activating enzyme